jgi:ABC-2 type transport system ATP-binding protein
VGSASAAATYQPQRAIDEFLLRTEGLTKRYGQRTVVDGLNLEVRRGDVFGLLGPNGSGKTTTLRMLLSLVRPTSGRIEVFGRSATHPAQLREAASRIGALVEQPAFYPYLGGEENLTGVALLSGMPRGRATRERIREALAQVGLAARGRDAYRTYSLGMKQRLGIAAALLTDSELLVLDEPTNGLDPAGMVDVRALVERLARAGKTIVLASHLLHEVQHLCTRVAILKDGRLLAQGPVSDLATGVEAIEISFARPEELPRALAAVQTARASGLSWLGAASFAVPEAGGHAPPGGWCLLVNAPADRAPEIARLLAARDLFPTAMRPREAGLERIFLALTGESTAEAGTTPPEPSQPSRPFMITTRAMEGDVS